MISSERKANQQHDTNTNRRYNKMQVKVKQLVEYNGHGLRANGSVDLNLKVKYSGLVNTIQLMQLLNNDITIKARVSNKVTRLGIFRIKNILIDGDGESKLKFVGLSDYIEMDELNNLPLSNEDAKEFYVMYEADVEEENTEE